MNIMGTCLLFDCERNSMELVDQKLPICHHNFIFQIACFIIQNYLASLSAIITLMKLLPKNHLIFMDS